MAVNPLTLYNSGFLGLFDGSLDWDDLTNVAAVLLTSSYTPDLTHSTYADLTDECADADYTPQAVENRSTTRDGDYIVFDSDKVTFGSAVTISAQYLVLVAGDPASLQSADQLIGYVDFGETKSSDNAEFSFEPSSNGWCRVSRA